MSLARTAALRALPRLAPAAPRASPSLKRTVYTLEKPLYTARAGVIGGRNGKGHTDDGELSVTLVSPKELGGSGKGTNPEQLFALGYAACYRGAMAVAQKRLEYPDLPKDLTVDAAVTLGKPANDDDHPFALAVELYVRDSEGEYGADKLAEVVKVTHNICPYSLAIKGNVEVKNKVESGDDVVDV